jgi:hypothetical protein
MCSFQGVWAAGAKLWACLCSTVMSRNYQALSAIATSLPCPEDTPAPEIAAYNVVKTPMKMIPPKKYWLSSKRENWKIEIDMVNLLCTKQSSMLTNKLEPTLCKYTYIHIHTNISTYYE